MRPVLKTGAQAYWDAPNLGLVACIVTSVTASCIRARVTTGAGPYRPGHPLTCLNKGEHSAIVPAEAVQVHSTCASVLRFTVEIDP